MFLFKNIVGMFLSPLSLSLALLLVGLGFLWFSRRQRAGKILMSAGVGLLLIFSYSFIPDLALRPLERRYPVVPDLAADQTEPHGARSAKWVVVLSGGFDSDPELPVTSQLSPASLERLLEAVRLHRARPGRKLILSGGAVFHTAPESRVMGQVALIMGVDPQDILLESTSRDTEEQARLLKHMVGRDDFFLVTSASHLPRAMAMFHRLGMEPTPAPAGRLTRSSARLSPGAFFPTSTALKHAEVALHEYLGLAWAWLRGVI